MKTRIRILKMNGEFESTRHYGFAYLAWYEQEFVKVYGRIISDDKISLDRKKYLISVVLTKIMIREIEWSLIIEQQEVIKKFFTYWKE
jgi:hypothetical protein